MPGLPALPYMAAAAPGQEVTTTLVSARHRRASAFRRPAASTASGWENGVSWVPTGPAAQAALPCPSTREPVAFPGDGCAGDGADTPPSQGTRMVVGKETVPGCPNAVSSLPSLFSVPFACRNGPQRRKCICRQARAQAAACGGVLLPLRHPAASQKR